MLQSQGAVSRVRHDNRGMNAQDESTVMGGAPEAASQKITALHPVVVCAKVEGRAAWLAMETGDTKVVDEIFGIHPNLAPEMTAIYLRGATFVPAHIYALPAEPFGLFRVEKAA